MMSALRRSYALVAALLLVAVAPALGSTPDVVRDEFNDLSYAGTDGTIDWAGPWLESPLTNSPSDGEIRVVSDTRCAASFCLRFGPGNLTGRGVYRKVDLSSAVSATLSFSSLRDIGDGDGDHRGSLTVAISSEGWSWTSLAEYPLDSSDNSPVTRAIDLSPWAGDEVRIGFFGSGDLGGYFFVDDVELAFQRGVGGGEIGSALLVQAATAEASAVEVNSPPTISYIPDQGLAPGDTVFYMVEASDPDIPANTISFSATGLPPGVAIDRSTGLIAGTIPAEATSSSGTATVTAADDGVPVAQSVTTFSWQISIGNRAPILAPIADQDPDDGGVIRFTAEADDGDEEDLPSFWLAAGIDPIPDGATIDAVTGEFVWSPTDAQHGETYRINVGVSDSGSPRLSDTQLVTIVVPKLNAAPVVTPLADQRSVEGEDVLAQIEASDTEGTTLDFEAYGLPSGLAIDSASGVISGAIDFEAAAGSPYQVTVKVSDDGRPTKAASVTFQWFVAETNRPPTVSPTDVVVILGDPTSLTLDVLDPDGDELTFTLLEPPAVGNLEGQFPALVYTGIGGVSDRFTYEVSDGDFSVEGVVTIALRTSNEPPAAEPDQYEVPADSNLSVAAPGVLGNDEDPDGDPLTAVVIAPPDHGELALNPDGSLTFSPESGFVGGDKFIYAAVDALGSQSLTTVVLAIGDPAEPTVTSIPGSARTDVLAATAASWRPPVTEVLSGASEARLMVSSSVGAGMASISELWFPLVMLAVALVAATVGRISPLPFTAGKTEEAGRVATYDGVRGLGKLIPDDDGDEVFVAEGVLDSDEPLVVGQRVEFIAATIKDRRIALRVWPAT